MYRRKWCETSKKSINVETDNIIIIMKEDNLYRDLCVFDRRVKLRVRPFSSSLWSNVLIALNLAILNNFVKVTLLY